MDLSKQFGHFLENPKGILDDLDSIQIPLPILQHGSGGTPVGGGGSGGSTKDNRDSGLTLYSATREDAGSDDDRPRSTGGLTFGVARKSDQPTDKPTLTLASLRKDLKDLNDAGSHKRAGLLSGPSGLQLYSIIIALYRPGPAFRVGHLLRNEDLQALTDKNAEPWSTYLAPKMASIQHWARHAFRLEMVDTRHRGSGTVLEDGRILTAWHVIADPGWIFGKPPNPAAKGRASLDGTVGGTFLNREISGYDQPTNTGDPPDRAWIHTSATAASQIQAADDTTLTGLSLQATQLFPDYLAGRKVIVLGHPGPPNKGEEEDAAKIAYKDASYLRAYKRCMPGMIRQDKPTEEINGLTYIRHDCSTLAGTSGGCLIDLETGAILGLHVSGIERGATDRNLALAAWCL
ncbi:trypsin-like peptidase domain-containing protein [Verrucomicrobium sp. BvORR034]|uniref:trypsin-like peptidase domain-containing protein n=1 Tax=Verrucomicrobium sp. BvORR034 TaxID=1396418 RepID=UPI0006786B84|nr:trypsin-like peptidase domain-containing protein [Verrucomicrobium sp. BvORR034]